MFIFVICILILFKVWVIEDIYIKVVVKKKVLFNSNN